MLGITSEGGRLVEHVPGRDLGRRAEHYLQQDKGGDAKYSCERQTYCLVTTERSQPKIGYRHRGEQRQPIDNRRFMSEQSQEDDSQRQRPLLSQPSQHGQSQQAPTNKSVLLGS